SDLVLRVVLRRAVPVPLVVEIGGMDLDDMAADPSGLGIPRHMVADGEICHFRLLSQGNVPEGGMFQRIGHEKRAAPAGGPLFGLSVRDQCATAPWAVAAALPDRAARLA